MTRYLILTIISFFVSGAGLALTLVGCMQDVEMAIIFGCISFISCSIGGLSWCHLFIQTLKFDMKPFQKL